MRKQVKIRADGNAQIGHGHIVRCIALAHMVSKSFDVYFYCKPQCGSLTALVETNGFSVTRIENDSSFFEGLTGQEIVVLDGYSFDFKYQGLVKSRGSILVFLDDLYIAGPSVDLIINHAPRADRNQYKTSTDTICLLGPEYALLRPEFLEAARNAKIPLSIKRLVICFGGADPANYTIAALKVAMQFYQLNEITVVTGSSYRYTDELSELIKGAEKIQHFRNVSGQQLVDLILNSELAIVPASGILLEVLSLKRFAVSGYCSENQRDFYRGFLALNAIEGCNDFSRDDLEEALTTMLVSKPRELNHQVIDGHSGQRISHQFLDLFYRHNLKIRQATSEDSQQYFVWANDSEVRNNSINQEEIEWSSHQKWFSQKIAQNTSKLYIFYCFGSAVGQVRFDLVDKAWLISFSVDKDFRGERVGAKILKAAMEEIKKYSNVKLRALVKTNNIASIRVFQSLGFKESAIKDNYLYFELE